MKFIMGLHLGHSHRKVGRGHLLFEHALQAASSAGAMKDEPVFRFLVQGAEKRKALDVVPVKMRDENMSVDGAGTEFMAQAHAEGAETSSAIENVKIVAEADFDAGGVASIPHVFGVRSGRGTTHTPKLNAHRLLSDE